MTCTTLCTKPRLLLVLFGLVLMTGSASLAQGHWIDLFNGSDLSGWTNGGVPWTVQSGILTNTQGYENDWIRYDTPLPSDDFMFEMRVRMVSGMRLRTHMWFDGLYLGNEGFTRQFEVYGGNLTGVSQVADDGYVNDQWYTLRLVVTPAGTVQLYKDGTLTHTGSLTGRQPVGIVIVPGDHWSQGQVQISSVRYFQVPEPLSAITLLSGLAGLGGIALPRLRRRKIC